MRTRASLLAALAVAALVFSGAAQGEPGSSAKKVDAILAGLPARTAAERTARSAELLSSGKDGLRELLERLALPGTADDTSVRYAVESLTNHVNRPGGTENDRLAWSKALLSALDRRREPEIKAFLIERLRLVGRSEAVTPLARYLTDAKLAGPAARALRTTGGPEAETALLGALKLPGAADRPAVVGALAGFRSQRAAEGLLPFARGEDRELRTAALDALAEIADPASEPVLAVMPVASPPGERLTAASRYLHYGRRLAEAGRRADAARIARSLLLAFTAPGEGQVLSAALSLIVDVEGEKAMDELLDASASSDPGFRNHALSLAREMPGPDVTARWVARIPSVPGQAAADIVDTLGRRGDASALPVILGALRGKEPMARLSAISAAARLGGAKVLADLMPLVGTSDEAEARALEGALLSLPPGDVLPGAIAALPDASAAGKAALMRVLSARRATEAADIILAQASSEDPNVRLVALDALGAVARPGDLPPLIALLSKKPAPAEVLAIQAAIAAAANKDPDEDVRARLLLEAMAAAEGEARIDLMRPLARIGSPRALEAVIKETRNLDPKVKAVAVHTLASWRDASALVALRDIARSTDDRKFAYLALQGYVRLVTGSDGAPDRKLAGLLSALADARTPEEKRLAVAGLSRIRTPESFRAATGLLSEPELRTKAAESAARIAMPSSTDPGTAGTPAARFLKKAAALLEDEGFREQVERRTAELLAEEGFVPLFNGEDLLGWRGLVEDPVKRARMSAAERAAAARKADEDARAHWTAVDGVLTFDGQGRSLCTARDYGDFELFVDWRIRPDGDSGIYLRGSPQVQIWDPARWPEGSGGLYNNRIGPSKPLAAADNPVGSWNTFHIIMKGERVTVYLNDVLVVDDVVLENYWERDKPIYPSGAIELQAHTTPLEFREIHIKELPR